MKFPIHNPHMYVNHPRKMDILHTQKIIRLGTYQRHKLPTILKKIGETFYEMPCTYSMKIATAKNRSFFSCLINTIAVAIAAG